MPQNDAERLGLKPKPRAKEELDAKYGAPVSDTDTPVAINLPDTPPVPAAVIGDNPEDVAIDLSTLTLADIGTKITTIDQLNQLLGVRARDNAVNLQPAPVGRTERQNEQLLAEQEAGRKRVAFYEQQKVINPKPVDASEGKMTPVFQSGDTSHVVERDAARLAQPASARGAQKNI